MYLVKFEGSWVLFTISSISLYRGSLYQGSGVLYKQLRKYYGRNKYHNFTGTAYIYYLKLASYTVKGK